MNIQQIKSARWLTLAPATILVACGIAATAPLWQSVAQDSSASSLLLNSAFDSNGNLYQIYRNGTYADPQVFVRSVSASGKQLWRQQPSSGTSASDVIRTFDHVTACDGGVLLSGQYRDQIAKFDNQGNLEWEHNFSTAGRGENVQVTTDSSCNAIVTRTLQNSDPHLHPLEIDQFDEYGHLRWSQTINLTDTTYQDRSITVSLLENGNIRLILLKPAAPNDLVELDTTGTVIRHESLGDRSGWVLVSDDSRIVLHVDHDTIESRNPDGSLAWTQTVDASLGKCAASAHDTLLCDATDSTNLQPTLIQFDLASGNPTSHPVSYQGSVDSVVWLGDQRWLVQESIRGDEKLAQITAQPFYARLHILSDTTVKETSTITLTPGKGRMVYLEEADGYIWNQTTARDNTQAFKLKDNRLLVSGWFGEASGAGIVGAKAYAVK